MSRQKGYKEEEVVEKAMNLFWRNGYEATSMAMLEQEMGINKLIKEKNTDTVYTPHA